MATGEPITISMAWRIHASEIDAIGAIDVTLNCDTNLFIDPLLLAEASNEAFAECANSAYTARFEKVGSLLAASTNADDLAERSAKNLLKFHEVPYTHLGYSGEASGSGFGTALTDNLAANAKQAIELGVRDPDLFVALSLFEVGVGADRISDMATNIIIDCLAAFTLQGCEKIGIETEVFKIATKVYRLPPNPLNPKEPILLVPKDIVRDLPVAADWASVRHAAQETADIKDRVSAQIGEIWEAKTRKEKDDTLKRALGSKNSFDLLLELIRAAAGEPYDIKNDHRGEIYPAELRRQIAATEPLELTDYSKRHLSLDEAHDVVGKIIDQFKSLIEHKGLWKELWNEKVTRARLEKAMQRLFYAVAVAYCEANELDISPESDAGCGPVDFKMSSGSRIKILAELKRSSNPKLIDGYTKQIEAYKGAEGTTRAFYIIVDIGGLTHTKMRGLSEARSVQMTEGKHASEIVIIDGNPQKSASKR